MTRTTSAGDDLHAAIATRLTASGQRYTANRRAIVDVLADAGGPLSLPQILDRRSSLPQSSVYRNLTVLEQAGAVERIATADEFSRYELAHDLSAHHHHLVCSSCGSLDDVSVPAPLEAALDKELARLARRRGFEIRRHRLDLVGLCATCRPRT